ncbi:MAG: UDP-glucose/GDP-mannose dehydrogenase family protein [Candidatus Altiarchaeota archaeon]
MNISIVGTGYVGLVTGAGFAEKGHNVVCVDVDEEKVALINSKIAPIYEEGLDDILAVVVGRNLKATSNLREAVLSTDATFISVGTPSSSEGQVDLKYVRQVAEDIGRILKDKEDYHVVVVKSTVIPGSTEEVVIPLVEKHSGKKAGKDFGVAMNPEFLREGVALQDFANPDRIVIGSIDQKSGDLVESIYFDFTSPVLRTNLKTAEMIKYTSNSLLATKISFINEVGNMCKEMGIDVYDVAKGVGMDKRISPNFLNAGPGFGGSCFPKDVSALVYKAKKVGTKPLLLESVLEVNRNQPRRVVELVKKKYAPLKGKRIGVLGLAFKEGTDDIRESPAIPIVAALAKEGANIYAYDPQARANAEKALGDKVTYCSSAKEALKDASLALVLTEWKEFKSIDCSSMKEKKIFDTRKIVNTDLLPKDVSYEGLCW